MAIADITIITASFNSQKFLEKTVISVAKQKVLPKKHLIIDDCSTDGSLILAERLAQKYPHVEVIRHDKNKGFPASLNTGISRVNTKYVGILDSDDIAMDYWLEITTGFLEANSDYGLVGGGGNLMTEGGGVTNFFKFCQEKGDVTDLVKHGKYVILHPGTVFKKSLLDIAGGYREDLKSTEDNDLYINFASLSKIYSLGMPLIYYRKLRSSESRVSDEYRKLIDEYINEKVHLLKNGLSINQANERLKPIVEKMKDTPRLSGLKSGQYQRDMGAAFFEGKQFRRAFWFLLWAFFSGNGFNNLRWAGSILKNGIMGRNKF